MGPDQPEPDEPDAPRAVSRRPASADHAEREPQAPVSRAEQLAAHLEYRETVAATMRAAADHSAWPRAVAELRAAWAEHQQKYPERARAGPRTEPDGSWACGAHRRLDPEQNAEAGKAHADLADEASRRILPALRRVEAADPERKLAGLEHMVKGEDRLKEKIADYLRAPGVTVQEAAAEVPDAVRFTLCYSADRYSSGVLTDIDRLKYEGWELVKLKNLWAADQYKGVNSQWRSPETGSRCEVQFHTPDSLDAKELTHEAYERLRSTTVAPTEERELEQFQRRVNALVSVPPGIEQIKDFPEKR